MKNAARMADLLGCALLCVFLHRSLACLSSFFLLSSRACRKIEFDTPNKWVNPLMGWTSARDTAQQLREMMWFARLEDATAFAEREGFHYTLLPYHSKKLKAKAFADNFKWCVGQGRGDMEERARQGTARPATFSRSSVCSCVRSVPCSFRVFRKGAPKVVQQ